ncbi:hypothetical protein BGZ88_002289, partial [Linnemannia elongata]
AIRQQQGAGRRRQVHKKGEKEKATKEAAAEPTNPSATSIKTEDPVEFLTTPTNQAECSVRAANQVP